MYNVSSATSEHFRATLNAATARLSGGVGGAEAQIVGEIKGELQAAQAQAQAAQQAGDGHAPPAQAPSATTKPEGATVAREPSGRAELSKGELRGEGRGSSDSERRRVGGSASGVSARPSRSSGRVGGHTWH